MSQKYICFHHKTYFNNSEFCGNVDFSKASFKEFTQFSSSVFCQNTVFNGVEFHNKINFFKAIFKGEVSFLATKFLYKKECSKEKDLRDKINYEKSKNNFQSSHFYSYASFSEATFEDSVNFSEIRLSANSHLSFRKTKFNNFVFFSSAHIQSKCFFSKADFENTTALDFEGSDFSAGLNVDDVIYPKIDETNQNIDILKMLHNAFNVFRNAAKSDDKMQTELDLFAKELKCSAYIKGNPIKSLIFLYEFFSNYGRSISRPLITWIISIAVFWFLHFLFLNKECYLFVFIIIIFIICMCFCKSILKLTILSLLVFAIPSFLPNTPNQALQLSLKGAVPFVSDQTTFYDRIFADDNQIENESELTAKITDNITKKETIITETSLSSVVKSDEISHSPLPFDNSLELYILPFLHGLQTIFSLLCLFLFGLGIRNNLRLK